MWTIWFETEQIIVEQQLHALRQHGELCKIVSRFCSIPFLFTQGYISSNPAALQNNMKEASIRRVLFIK